MVGKGQRHQPAPGEPASDPTQDDAVGEALARRRRCQGDRLVLIRSPQRLQPTRRVERRCAGMPFDEVRPSRIIDGIDSVNRYTILDFA